MGDKTSIQWTEATWNPVTGCTKVSPGCAYCYAERITRRHKGAPFLPDRTIVQPRSDRLNWPLKWKQPRLIFTSSMTDIFHEAVDFEFILRVVDVMRAASWHTFQVLTKRPQRMKEFVDRFGPLPENAWLGTSVENQRWAEIRLPQLVSVPAPVRFVSCEPLLGPLNLAPWLGRGLDWVIVGGESGGPMTRRLVEKSALGWTPKEDSLIWSRSIRDDCAASGTPFFFKQWGGPRSSSGGRELDGETWNQWPREPCRSNE